MDSTKLKVRLVVGAFLVVLGVAIWSQDNSSLIGQGGWIRNWYYFVPGFIFCWFGALIAIKAIHETIYLRKKPPAE